jgi:hypothetical protein
MPAASQLRRDLAELAALANIDLGLLFRQVDTPEAAREALYDLLPALVETYGVAAGALAADWYDDTRDELEIAGTFRAITAEPDVTDLDITARWGIGPLFQAAPAWDDAQTLLAGSMQRRISNVARLTVSDSSISDPRADGWQRSASGGCTFCQMIASRGAVFTARTVDFASHDHCNCVAVPAFKGRARPVRPYTPSERNSTDAEQELAEEYLASHDAG